MNIQENEDQEKGICLEADNATLGMWFCLKNPDQYRIYFPGSGYQ